MESANPGTPVESGPSLVPKPTRAPGRPQYDDDLRLAHVICDQVDALTLNRFRAQDLVVDTKPDLTVVSDADKLAESAVRAQLSRTRSRDAVVGEEMPPTGHSSRCWVVDPIDGTENFVRGVPVWATLLALMVDGEPVLGVVSAPAMQRRWWAATGSGAWTGRSLASATQMQVSQVSRLEDASLAISNAVRWEKFGRLEQILELHRAVHRTRGYGDFWAHMLVAEGAVDMACEPNLALHDIAALVPIVQEAGGSLTTLDGKVDAAGGSALTSNKFLHQALQEALALR